MGASRFAARSRVRIAVRTRVACCRSEVGWRLLNLRKDFFGCMLEAKIIERGRGPEVAGTRITVYDVLDYHSNGWHRDMVAEVEDATRMRRGGGQCDTERWRPDR